MNIQYSTPTCTDTAVCMCFFSPAGFQKPKQNLLYVEKLLRDANIPTFTIECVIGDQKPVIENPTVQVKSNTYLFYKEQLYNLLVPKIPEQYTKLIFIDADILFSNSQWVDRVSNALDTYDIVQPFQTAKWFDYDNKTVIQTRKGTLFGLEVDKIPPADIANDKYHPGFTVAMRRSYFDKIHGFFDKCIFGGGDTMFCNTFVKKPNFKTFVNFITYEYIKWFQHATNVSCKFSYMPFTVYHLYHGKLVDRQYISRYERLQEFKDVPFDSLFFVNQQGLYETTNEKLNQIMKDFFHSRNEDYEPSKQVYSRFRKLH